MLMSGKQDLFSDTDENNSKGVFQQFDMGIIDVSWWHFFFVCFARYFTCFITIYFLMNEEKN